MLEISHFFPFRALSSKLTTDEASDEGNSVCSLVFPTMQILTMNEVTPGQLNV